MYSTEVIMVVMFRPEDVKEKEIQGCGSGNLHGSSSIPVARARYTL